MGNDFYRGDLIRWVVGHDTYESDGDTLYGTDPIYNHGIIMEVSDVDPACIIVHSRDVHMAPRLVILNGELDEIHILSSAEQKNEQ
tara:strand:+ start:2438 stop:2695 length:258 start_codon:yes stop_codon:yes gene_type:complete